MVFAGGIIPEADVPELKAAGVKAVYGPGTSTSLVVSEIQESVFGKALV